MAVIWNPRAVLNVDPISNPRCSGMAVKTGERCRSSVSPNDNAAAEYILDRMALEEPTSLRVTTQLAALANVVLCRRSHRHGCPQSQVQQQQHIWITAIDNFTLNTQISLQEFIADHNDDVSIMEAEKQELIDDSFEDSGIDLSADNLDDASDFEDTELDVSVVKSEQGCVEISSLEATGHSKTKPKNSLTLPPFIFGEPQSHHISAPFEPCLLPNTPMLPKFQINIVEIQQSLEAFSSLAVDSTLYPSTPVKSLAIDISPGKIEEKQYPTYVANLSCIWSSIRHSTVDYLKRYRLLISEHDLGQNYGQIMRADIGTSIAGCVGLGCVLWWTLRRRLYVESLM